jgi:CheY-like chemotaxis protein
MNRRVMRTLIVDDEPVARQVLREELETLLEVVVVGEAENGKQALQQIAALQPDLVLLDLQMPVMGGFEVVRKLGGGHLPVVVIVTAFDQHAIEAFEAGAVDYLLKPVGEERLRQAVERAQKLCANPLEVARYDSGLVAGSVGSLDDALALTGAQQAAIGFFCGSLRPAIGAPLTDAQCTPASYGATRLVIPAPGTENDDHNPPRIAPRHVFEIAAGTDNLFKKDSFRTTLRMAVTNFTNKDALYNFLSTFSGTHFIQPRAYQTAIGFVF